jgi:hypothetical protein
LSASKKSKRVFGPQLTITLKIGADCGERKKNYSPSLLYFYTLLSYFVVLKFKVKKLIVILRGKIDRSLNFLKYYSKQEGAAKLSDEAFPRVQTCPFYFWYHHFF